MLENYYFFNWNANFDCSHSWFPITTVNMSGSPRFSSMYSFAKNCGSYSSLLLFWYSAPPSSATIICFTISQIYSFWFLHKCGWRSGDLLPFLWHPWACTNSLRNSIQGNTPCWDQRAHWTLVLWKGGEEGNGPELPFVTFAKAARVCNITLMILL